MTFSRLRLFAPAFLGFASFSPAAQIDWQPPFNITSVNNIDTSGTLVGAVNAVSGGGNVTVNVGGENILFTPSPIGPANTNTGTFFTGGGGDTGDANLNTILNSHSYGPGNAWSIQLTGLSPGADYQIQLIGGGDTRGCCSSRNQRAGDGESPESISGDFSRSGVGSVIGTFTADATTQTINVLPGLNNGVDPSLSAYLLRSVAPPTPQPPTDIALDNTDLAPNSAPGTLVGTLTTADPNGDNEHTYQLVAGAGSTDNALFTIANGDELRADTTLGGFGASYSVRIRTTDPDGLFLEETFSLSVEAAAAPTSISFPTNTLLQGLPSGTVVAAFSTEDANTADSHTYQLVSGTGDNDNNLFTINGDTLTTAAALPPLGSVLSFRVRSTDLSGLSVEETFSLGVVSSSIRINEFLANNSNDSLQDEDGDRPDWIELYNPDGGLVSLNGMYLTDDPTNLTKWPIPNVNLAGGGYLVIFASSKDRRPTNGDNLHTNFSLNANGEYLALVAADGLTVLSEFGSALENYPPQNAGNTFGFFGDPLQSGFLLNPTPGAENDSSSGVSGFVEDTVFSVTRGFYDTPFSLEITSATPGATIRYTTDGSWPDESTGTIYTGPITINRTMPVKAIAYRAGYVSTNIDTHTYILVDSVVQQTSSNTTVTYGLPTSWGGQTPYYGMNNNSNVNPAAVTDDLKAVPSLSIAMETNDMFGSSGIYSNPQSSGQAWERKTSLEMLDPSGQEIFQQYCAIRIQGGAFRSFGLTRKKSFRVLFKSQFGTSNEDTGGPGSLDFPLFGTEPGTAREFQTLIFRMESNDGWQWSGAGGQPQYARDEFGRRIQRALGQPASNGRYLHLYINGVYWGLYNVVERPDSGFAESYVESAQRDLWEGQNSGSPINSSTNLNFWNSYRNEVAAITSATGDAARDAAFLESCGFNPDGSRNPAFPIWCDPTNNADYFITNWYGGNSDWPNKNYYGGIDTQSTRTGYKYFMWDAEWSLFLRSNTNYNRITDYRGIADPNRHLQLSPEYRLRFGDRVHRALFNDGPLTPDNATALYEEITSQHTSILNPEAARWGNQHGQNRSVSDWQIEYNRIVNNWFPVRGDLFLNSLRSAGLYPNLTAPTYSQHGGSIPQGSGPSIIVPGDVNVVYYLFGDGDSDPTDFGHSLDPRLTGGAINPAAQMVNFGGGGPGITNYISSGDDWNYLDDGSDQGTAWRDSGFDDSNWETGPSQLGYGDGDENTVVDFVDADPGQAGIQRNATTYFRKTITIADPTVFEDFSLTYLYDDGVAVYVNGTEVARVNLAAGATSTTYSNGSSSDNSVGSVTLSPSSFVAGQNTIAVEIHNSSGASSDISFDLSLTGNPPGGGSSNVSPPLSLPGAGWLFSRSYNPTTQEWSALNTAFFSPDTVPADATNLVISEFSYQPGEPVAANEIAVSTDRDDYEFVELMNVSSQTIDLTGVRFTTGITFTFADNTLIPAGGRLVVVKNIAAFQARYGTSLVLASDTIGNQEYGGRLSNGGEQLTLLDATDTVIHDFIYDDELPWPYTDGTGFTMVLKSPAQPVPGHAVATNWVASTSLNGVPGGSDDIGFTGVPTDDLDLDGYNALLEYALGTSESVAGDAESVIGLSSQNFFVDGAFNDYLVITFNRNLLGQNAVTLVPEISDDLVGWNQNLVLVSEVLNPDLTATMQYRGAVPISDAVRQFIRLKATQ
jgi:hypothetical protein